MISIALIKPPNLGNAFRGAGFYAERLFAALKKRADIKISWESFRFLPAVYRQYDLVHFPYFDEYFFTLPPLLPKKSVVSILDCTKLKFKEHFPVGPRGKIAWAWQKKRANKATAVVTISKSAKNDIETYFAIPASRISVTYLAADPVFKPSKTKRDNFVLYVGGVNWNKNLPTLIRACQKIKVNLVLVGKEFLAQDVDFSNVENQPLKEILKLIKNDSTIKTPGFIPTNDLVKIYNRAKVYVQPSVYEGFGLPVLEALSCGTPVICGSNGSLPEIAGDAATYADVTSVNDLAEKISNVEVTGKEVVQANKFSWEKTAAETVKVYEKVLAGI